MAEYRAEPYCEKVGHEVQIKFIVQGAPSFGGFRVATDRGRCRFQNECGVRYGECAIINKLIQAEAERITMEYNEEMQLRKKEAEKWGF